MLSSDVVNSAKLDAEGEAARKRDDIGALQDILARKADLIARIYGGRPLLGAGVPLPGVFRLA